MSFDYLWQSSRWADSNGDTPPQPFHFLDDDGRYYFDDTLTYVRVDHIGLQELPETLLIDWEILEAPVTGNLYFQYDLAAGGQAFVNLGDAVGTGRLTITNHLRTGAFSFSVGTSGAVAFLGITTGGSAAIKQVERSLVTAEWERIVGARTLLSMRTELVRQTGYAGQLTILPTGIAELYTSFIRQAQEQIFGIFPAIETTRWFRFPVLIGIRYYEFRSNVDPDAVFFDPDNVESVHLIDNNDFWSPPLKRGIQPQAYTTLSQNGYPSCWDFDTSLEIFPPPQAEYYIAIKGKHGLGSLVDDDDYITIKPEPVFQYALGLAKNHKKPGSGGRSDGPMTMWTGHFAMAAMLAQKAIASQHNGRRYIPQFGGGSPPDYIPNPPMMEEFLG
jgi:hypothetical protein